MNIFSLLNILIQFLLYNNTYIDSYRNVFYSVYKTNNLYNHNSRTQLIYKNQILKRNMNIASTKPSISCDVNQTLNYQYIIGKSAKYIVSIIAMIFILTTNTILPTYYVLCGIINSIISKILKITIKQPRPVEANKSGYGI